MRYRLTNIGNCPTLDPALGRWSRLVDIDGNQLQAHIVDLVAYSRYQVKIWARTSAGRGQVAVAYGHTAAAGMCLSMCPSSVFYLSVCLFLLITVVLLKQMS